MKPPSGLGIRTPIWQRLDDVVSYVFTPSVLLVLFGTAVMVYALQWIPAIGGILAGAVEASIFFHIVQTTAFGERDLEPPSVDNVVDDLLMPLLRYLAAVLPIIVALVWAGLAVLGSLAQVDQGESPTTLFADMTGPLLLLVAGLALLPLLLAIAAIGRSVIVMFNPAVWISSLRTLGWDYWVAAILFWGVLALEYFVMLPALYRIWVDVDVAFVVPVLTLFVATVPWALRARLIGALCEPYVGVVDQVTSPPQPYVPSARSVASGSAYSPPPARPPAPLDFMPPREVIAAFDPDRVTPVPAATAPPPLPPLLTAADLPPQTPPPLEPFELPPPRGWAEPVEPDPPSAPRIPAHERDTVVDGYEVKLYTRLNEGDAEGVAALAPGVLANLIDNHRGPRAWELFRRVDELCPGLRLAERVLYGLAREASAAGEPTTAVRLAGVQLETYPHGRLLPAALWLAACAQEAGGRDDLMESTLQMLIRKYPDSSFAADARAKLEQRWRAP